ncbi:MAG: GNAT family N-acetyltransferase [Candidatus Kapaibacterium sp.]
MKITLRPAVANDLEFLDQIHTLSMRPHVEKIYTWDPGFFRRTVDLSRVQVIVVDDIDAGMLSVSEENGILHLRQISIAPDYVHQGIGTQVVGMVIDAAARGNMPLQLRVLRMNPAKRLYERLGFRTIDETETHYIMRRGIVHWEEGTITIRPIEHRESEAAKGVIRRAWREIFEDLARTEAVPDIVIDYFDDPEVLRDMDDIERTYSGGIFLAIFDGETVVGTGAVDRIDEEVCELRRMFLHREYRGRGLGGRITRILLEFARRAGYRRMRLGSNRKLFTAHGMYRHLGFHDIEPYEEGMEQYVLYMEKNLDTAD